MPRALRILKWPIDLAVTGLVVVFYALIGPGLFLPIYLLARILAPKRRERAFQSLNHTYYRCFFFLLWLLVPGLRIRIESDLRRIRGAVVVSNHVSFLDSILLVSVLRRHKTIVKAGALKIPILGWSVRNAGYLVVSADNRATHALLEQIEQVGAFLEAGGSLFVFPEGTRSRDGTLGLFKKGAFSIALRLGAPIELLRVAGTDRLFPPGAFLFNTCVRTAITLERIGRLEADQVRAAHTPARLAEQARSLYLPKTAAESAGQKPGEPESPSKIFAARDDSRR